MAQQQGHFGSRQLCFRRAVLRAKEIQDEALIERLRERRPRHIIVTLGGGNQERLGLYIKRKLDYRPSIHCIGAAIAFLSGDQVKIPDWADRRSLGWLYRCVSEPRRFVPRIGAPFSWRDCCCDMAVRYRH